MQSSNTPILPVGLGGSATTTTREQRDGGGIDWRQVARSFRDPTNYATAGLFFIANVRFPVPECLRLEGYSLLSVNCEQVTFASLPVYLPTILSEAGFGTVRAQGEPPLLSFYTLNDCSIRL